jgi:hypothetical protein
VTADRATMNYHEALEALQSLLGKQIVVVVQKAGADEGDHVATFHGVLERGHDYGAALRESTRQPGALTPDPMPKEREAILFNFVGRDDSFCLRPDQFTGAAWEETLQNGRQLVILLGGVEIVVEDVEDS